MEPDPKWDGRFLDLATHVAGWSKDPGSKVGAVIVRPNRTIASMGYNGFPRGCDDSDDLYNDREEKLARVVHAEVNAILNAYERLDEYTLYTSWVGEISPTCDRCATVVIQAGIQAVVHRHGLNERESNWSESLYRALEMYQSAGVAVIQYSGEAWRNVGASYEGKRMVSDLLLRGASA